jgi:hypothetical protein
MSTSYYAKSCIGVCLNRGQIYQTRLIDPCSCKDKGTGRFCQQCGLDIKKKLEEETLNSFVTEDESGDLTIAGYPVQGDLDGEYFYVGIGLSVSDWGDDDADFKPLNKGEVEDLYKNLKKALEAENLWNDDFGLHTWMEIGG